MRIFEIMERLGIGREGRFRQGKGGEYTRTCAEVDSSVIIFSTWNLGVWMKSQEGTSMELGMGMESVTIHSCGVLYRRGGGARVEAVRSRRKEREEQRGPQSIQSPCGRTFLKQGRSPQEAPK